MKAIEERVGGGATLTEVQMTISRFIGFFNGSLHFLAQLLHVVHHSYECVTFWQVQRPVSVVVEKFEEHYKGKREN